MIVAEAYAIYSLWFDVVAEAEKRDKPLLALLKGCSPMKLEDDVLTVSTEYEFHRNKLNWRKRADLESILSEIAGREIKVRCVLSGELNAI